MITVLITLALLGLITWALVSFVPMPEGIKRLIVIVAVVCGVLYALRVFGLGFVLPPVPHVRG